jgi:hypothetical protein
MIDFIPPAVAVAVGAVLCLRWLCAAHPEYRPDGPSFGQQMEVGLLIAIASVGSGLAASFLLSI